VFKNGESESTLHSGTVASRNLIEETKAQLGIMAKGRRIEGHPDELCVLKEEKVSYLTMLFLALKMSL
jgi:hypothetical protein